MASTRAGGFSGSLIDLTERTVAKVVDEIELAVPAERGEWDAAPHATPTRTDLEPIEITQPPDGASFTVDGNEIHWADSKFRFAFDVREGLTLHQLAIADDGVERPVIYRASVAEMVVPYAAPSPVRYWQNYFDQGEYLFGRYANSLELGFDCLGEIHYFDVTIADEKGHPRLMKNAICLHEEDFGVLWKHTDIFNQMAETRRSRRLVISFFLTIGNYDYARIDDLALLLGVSAVVALSPPAGITATTRWRRAAASLAVASAGLHVISLPEHAHSPAVVTLLAAMVLGCLYCARHLWSRGALRDWGLVAAMNLGMIGLHASMLGGGSHTGHSHGGNTTATAAPTVAMSPLMSAALALAAVEAALALAVVLFRTKNPSSAAVSG